MYRFISALDNKELCKRYLKLFKKPSLNKNFEELLGKYPVMANTIPLNYRKGVDLLTAPFEILVQIYFNFLQYSNSLSDKENSRICNEINKVMNYDGRSTRIGKFLSNPANGFVVHNCVYCDIHKVKGYTDSDTGDQIREFETEHVLDKGKCPLVALSLFNFVPSCGTCNNPRHKGTKTLGRTIDETVLLSPTTSHNQFEEEVAFTVYPINSDLEDLLMLKSENELEIDFKGAVDKYSRTIQMFRLKDRYNEEKVRIFELIEQRRTWNKMVFNVPGIYDVVSEEELFESFFGFKKRKRRHDPMEKCRRDIFEEHFGKIPE